MSVSMSLVDTGGTGDYTNLSIWEANSQADLTVGEGCISIVYCMASTGIADSVPVVLNGWTTNTGSYILIACTGSDKHNGFWDTAKYRLEYSGDTYSYLLWNDAVDNVYIEGIQFHLDYSGFSDNYGILLTGGVTHIEKCIVRGFVNEQAPGSSHGIYINNGIDNAYISNTIIYDWFYDEFSTDHYGIRVLSGNTYIYNCTVEHCNRGIRGPEAICKNVITQNCSDGFYSVNEEESDYNISDIDGDCPGDHSKDPVSVVFMDELGNDFRLASTDTEAKNAGTPLNDDVNYKITDDIAGRSRPIGVAWDIGAYEADEVYKIIFRGVGDRVKIRF